MDLIFSDIHLHPYKVFGLSKNSKMFKRLEEQIDILEQITTLLKKNNIKRVFFGGDLVHKVDGGVPVEAINVANKYISLWKKLGLEVYLVSGNHDQVDKSNPEWYESVISLFDDRTKLPSNIRLVDYSEIIDYNSLKGYDLVIIHQTPIDAKLGNYSFKTGVNWKEIEKHNKLVLYGHIHQRQQLSEKSFIIGSPCALNFADVNERGVYTLENGILNFIPLSYPKFITVDTPEETKNDGNYYRVLNASNKSVDSNIVHVVKPKYFDEKLKGNTFEEILSEWLIITQRPESDLEIIKDLLYKEQQVKKVFKGRISQIRIQNLFSFDDITIDLPFGLVQVKGGNGVGKTTLFDAIYWCLYGKTTKKLTGTDVVRDRPYQQDSAQVDIIITNTNGSAGKISRNSKTGLAIFKSLISTESIVVGKTQDERQKILQDVLLGISETLFLSACYFSQENLQMLTNIGDSDKTNLITGLLGFERYDSLYDECHAKQKVLKDSKPKIEKEIFGLTKTMEGTIEINIQLFRDCKEIENKISTQSLEINQLDAQILEITTIITEKINNRITENPNELTNYLMQIEKLQLEKEKIREQEKKDKLELAEHTNKLLSEHAIIAANKAKITELLKQKEALTIEILKIDKLEAGMRCSCCGAVILAENKEVHKKEKKDKIDFLEIQITDISNQQKITNTTITLINESIDKLNVKEKRSIQEIDKEISNLYAEDAKQKEKINMFDRVLNAYKENKKRLESKKEYILANNADLTTSILNKQSIMEQKKNQLEQQEMELDAAKKQLLICEEHIQQLELWKVAFSPRGIKSHLLSKFCNEFNLIVNRYVALVSNGTMVFTLTPDKELKNGEKRNEMGMDIISGNKSRKYAALSGGQKRRIDISLCLALNKWVSDRYLLTNGLLGILVFDEILSSVDPAYSENIATILQEEAQNKGIFIVAHNSTLEAYANHIWEVSLDEQEVSKIKYELN